MFEGIRTERVPAARRRQIEQAIRDERVTLTDVLLIEDQGLRIEFCEALTGWRRQGRVPVYEQEMAPSRLYRFRTVDGRPLGKVKVALAKGNARQLRGMQLRGEPLEVTEDHGAEFSLPAYKAIPLLLRHGWGFVRGRGRRGRIVEVGSLMEERAREAGELVESEPQRRGRRPEQAEAGV